MEPTSLIAYIPVLNKRHLDWFSKHPGANLHLIPQDYAEVLDPRQSRNIVAMPTNLTKTFIESTGLLSDVWILDDSCMVREGSQLVFLADDDICRAYAKALGPGIICQFEVIWARYDMSAVRRQSPVMDIPVTSDPIHRLWMEHCKVMAETSPDWWRQIGATLVIDGSVRATACNRHFPTDYVTDMMSDPRLTVDAGQVGKYVSFHAEKAVIIMAARDGIKTAGATLYTTVFPCEDCARAIVLAGIDTVFFEEGYSALDAREVLEGAGVKIVRSVRPT